MPGTLPTKPISQLATALIAAKAIPETEPRDAFHISIAATSGVKYLLTWNFKHIANAILRKRIESVCRNAGFEPPTICTPDELMGLKPVAIGRKNWLFVGSVEAGTRAAVLMSLVASCKLNQVEPWAYLRDCFEKLAGRSPGDSLDDLLPDRWLKDHPSHRWSIGSLRQQERST